MTMKTVTENHGENALGCGTFGIKKNGNFIFTAVSSTSESVEPVVIPAADIPDMSIYGKCNLVFTDGNGVHYEVKTSDKKRKINARKYISLWTIIKQ